MTKKSPTARAYVERIPRVWVGPLAPAVLPECSSWLKGQGYSSGSAAGIVNLLARLSIWMAEQGADVEDISPELLERFMHWERSRQVVAVGVTTCMAAMRRFLTAAGYLTTHGPDIAMMNEVQAEVAAWRAWMGDELGLVKKTVDARCRYAAGLLDTVRQQGAIQWFRLTPGVVNAYVLDRGKGYSVVTCGGIVTAVRCLLGWALSTGRIDRDLRAGILKMPGTKRTLPRGVSVSRVK